MSGNSSIYFRPGTVTHFFAKINEAHQITAEVHQHKINAWKIVSAAALLILALGTGVGLYFGQIGGSTTLMITGGVCLPSLVVLIICIVKTRSNVSKTREKDVEFAIPKVTAAKVLAFILKEIPDEDQNILKIAFIFDLDLAHPNNKIPLISYLDTMSSQAEAYQIGADFIKKLIVDMETNSPHYQKFQRIRADVNLDNVLRQNIRHLPQTLTRFSLQLLLP